MGSRHTTRRNGGIPLAVVVLIAATSVMLTEGPAVRAQTDQVVFGAYAEPRNGESQRGAIENLEQAIGRRFGGVRVYKRWNHAFPTDYDRWLRDGGRTLFLSLAAQWSGGALIPWRDIANAEPGSGLHDDLVQWARRVRDFDATVYFTFDHEPEGELGAVGNTRADFIDAWRRVVTIFRNNGATNARFTWILTAFTFSRSDGNGPWSWWPGDDYVDVIGADDYNWFGCRSGVATAWRSFAQIFEPVRAFGAAHPDKEVMLGEWGSVEDPSDPGRKAQWFRDALTTLGSPGWEQFRAVLYWHSHGHVGDPPCQFWVDTSQSALEAFATMGADPLFFPGGPPQVSALTPSVGPAGTVVTVTGINFSGVQRVTFAGLETSFSVSALSSLTATVPEGATAGRVAVTTGFGTATGPMFSVVHPRSISLSFGGGRRATGRISVVDGFDACLDDGLVKIQRRVPGAGWRTVIRTMTNGGGAYRALLRDRAGRYRAVASRDRLASSDICGKAGSRTVRHR